MSKLACFISEKEILKSIKSDCSKH